MDKDRAVIRTEHLDSGYGRMVVVADAEISVKRGGILVLIGPNGAGKSTVLRTIAGQLEAIGGTVDIDGSERSSLQASEIARKQAVMLTDRKPAERMTCEEVVSLGRYPYTGRLGILSEEDRRIVRDSMELVRVSEEPFRQLMARFIICPVHHMIAGRNKNRLSVRTEVLLSGDAPCFIVLLLRIGAAVDKDRLSGSIKIADARHLPVFIIFIGSGSITVCRHDGIFLRVIKRFPLEDPAVIIVVFFEGIAFLIQDELPAVIDVALLQEPLFGIPEIVDRRVKAFSLTCCTERSYRRRTE